ncbi:MAG: cysteine--tRNA ligase [Desulfobacteraceae bacterium 4572_130]|nr:MAG: cysteine--tRNA ligase [Desulfobacteraceae bacterium 4572_130]
MNLKIYNTFTGKKEEFIPIEKKKVKMYVCGPTVYDTSHIGHARSVVIFDVIFRWLKHLNYDVCYVRNFTDIDDKIIKKANQTGKDSLEISQKFIKEFHNEMDALNVLRPSIEPKATEHIQEIIDFIQLLIKKEKAYHIKGKDVFFSLESFKDYGKLSKRNPDDMKAGARICVNDSKKNHGDFVLWKLAKPGEPFWKSPWGNGRPGWHIECSAMSYKYLGKSFDIHGGGKDLIFPHHENEIAQSEAAFTQTFVKYWIHNGFVDINNEKMSKSLGNFIMIKDVLKNYHPDVIKLFLLSKHYRSPIDYNENSMNEVISGLDKIYAFLARSYNAGADININTDLSVEWEKFVKAMNDDFNSAKGIAVMFEAVKKGNKILDENKDNLSSNVLKDISMLYRNIKKIGKIFGLLDQSPEDYFNAKKQAGLKKQSIDEPEKIDMLIKARTKARKSKDFETADNIRKQLQDMNIILKDENDKTTWEFGH